jgi:hypothetical protein
MTEILIGIAALVGGFTLHTAEDLQPKIPLPPIPIPGKGPDQVDPKMPGFVVCAKACDDCARMCEMCVAHCARLLGDGRKEHLDALRLCQDCAAVCEAAARVTAKDGPMSQLVCTACADACKQCGDACEKHPADPMLKRCAEECRKCEKACREMIKK